MQDILVTQNDLAQSWAGVVSNYLITGSAWWDRFHLLALPVLKVAWKGVAKWRKKGWGRTRFASDIVWKCGYLPTDHHSSPLSKQQFWGTGYAWWDGAMAYEAPGGWDAEPACRGGRWWWGGLLGVVARCGQWLRFGNIPGHFPIWLLVMASCG